MRRLLAALAALSLALVAGCGSKGSSGDAQLPNPTAEALAYYAPDVPLVALVATDPKGAAITGIKSLAGKIPGASDQLSSLENKLFARLQTQGVDPQRDLLPLLGHPAAVGATTARYAGGHIRFRGDLIAWVTRSRSALATLKQRLLRRPGARSLGSYRGADLVNSHGTVFAFRGPVVLSGREAVVRAGLDRHASDERLEPSALAPAPAAALARFHFNAASLLLQPGGAQARAIPWLGALKAFDLSLAPAADGVDADARFTAGGNLDPLDVPLAAGDAPPPVADRPIAGGVHDPGHLVEFALRALSAARPIQGAELDAGLGIAGVDATQDIADQMRGNGSFQIDGQRFLFRAALKDPRAMFATLGKLVPLLRKRVNVVPAAPRIYEIRQAGVAQYAFGVYGGQFVAGTGSAGDLRDFAAAGAATVPGARGTLTFRVTADTLRGLVEDRAGIPGLMGHFLLSDIGDLTGWARASGSTLDAHAHLAIGG